MPSDSRPPGDQARAALLLRMAPGTTWVPCRTHRAGAATAAWSPPRAGSGTPLPGPAAPDGKPSETVADCRPAHRGFARSPGSAGQRMPAGPSGCGGSGSGDVLPDPAVRAVGDDAKGSAVDGHGGGEARTPPIRRQPLHDVAEASATFTQPPRSAPRTTATRRPPPAVADSAGSALTAPPTRRQADQVIPVRCLTHSALSVPTAATVSPPSTVTAAAGAVARTPPSGCQAPQRPPVFSRSQPPASAPRITTLSTPLGATTAAGLLVALPPSSAHPLTPPASVMVFSQTRLSAPSTNTAVVVPPTATAAGPPIRTPPSADQPDHDPPLRVRSSRPPLDPRTTTCTRRRWSPPPVPACRIRRRRAGQ